MVRLFVDNVPTFEYYEHIDIEHLKKYGRSFIFSTRGYEGTGKNTSKMFRNATNFKLIENGITYHLDLIRVHESCENITVDFKYRPYKSIVERMEQKQKEMSLESFEDKINKVIKEMNDMEEQKRINRCVDTQRFRLNDFNFGRGRSRINKVYKIPNRVIFNDKKKATTLIDDNDNVTVVKTMKGDKYNKEFGFLMAYFQHYSGLSKTQAKKYIKQVIEGSD